MDNHRPINHRRPNIKQRPGEQLGRIRVGHPREARSALSPPADRTPVTLETRRTSLLAVDVSRTSHTHHDGHDPRAGRVRPRQGPTPRLTEPGFLSHNPR